MNSKGDERVEDNELLKAIAQIVQAETKPLNERLDGLQADMSDVKGRLEAVEDRLGGVENELADVKERVARVEADTSRTKVLLEHDIPKQISILAEGHTGLLKHMATSDELDSMDSRVHTLESVVMQHSEDIAVLKRAAN